MSKMWYDRGREVLPRMRGRYGIVDLRKLFLFTSTIFFMIEDLKQGLLDEVNRQRENVEKEKEFDLPAWTHSKLKFLQDVKKFIEEYPEMPSVVII